ncbi:hypothetical protein EZS27_007015 [termite gut metagenome]|uniref:Uncharacterized protein n=1 Tax=termite gut metagenome TaxID=433724 RepID=A0A5J4SH01_9ZZZZ
MNHPRLYPSTQNVFRSPFAEAVKSKVAEVQKKNNETIQISSSIMAFYQMIIKLQSHIDKSNFILDEIHDILYENFNDISKDDYELLKDDLLSVIKSSSKVYSQIKKDKNIYSAVKTNINNMLQSISSLREIFNDILVFRVKLPEDEEYLKLEAAINAL